MTDIVVITAPIGSLRATVSVLVFGRASFVFDCRPVVAASRSVRAKRPFR
ncbi:MAG: hypothetical protein QM597_07005 [Aeromicrobium sp.]